MKKLTLRVKRRIILVALILGFFMMLPNAFSNTRYLAFLCIGLGLDIVALVLDIIWWRCPYCNAYLRYHRDGDYCKECGKRVFLDHHDLPNHTED